MIDLLQNFLSTFGYLAVAVGVMLEGMGIPLPGETLLLLGAAYAGAGNLNVWAVILAAALGAMIGDSTGYWIGRRGGRALLTRYGRVIRLREEHLMRAELFFAQHGDKTVFVARFIAVLRMFAAFLAGVNRMPYRRFVAFNVAGGVTWALTFGLLGAAFGSQWPLIEHWIGRAGELLAGIAALVVLAVFGRRWVLRHEQGLRARWASFVAGPRMTAARGRFAPQIAFLEARLHPSGYLGLHLTIGVILIVVAGWIFAGITEDVLHHDPLVDVDDAVSRYLAAHRARRFTAVMLVLSRLGSPVTSFVVVGVLAIYFLTRRRYYEPVLLVLAVAGAELVDVVLKVLIARQRPSFTNPLQLLTTYSFPSGHAMGSMACYGLLAYLLMRHTPRWSSRVTIGVIAVVIVLLIGFSRVYLGEHFMSDVLGGYAGGFVWLIVVITGVNIVTGRQQYAKENTKIVTGDSTGN